MSGRIRKTSVSQIGLAGFAANLEPNAKPGTGAVVLVPIDQIRESPENGRILYDEKEMRELCQSIQERGLDEPVSLVPRDGFYEVIDGHRRFRAHQALGLAVVPCIIRSDLDEAGVRLARLSSIYGKASLRPFEEARYLDAALRVEGMTRQLLCQKTGISSGTLRNRLEILECPEAIAIHVGAHGFGMEHARLLKPLHDHPAALAVAVQVVEGCLKQGVPTVRDLYKLVAKALVKEDLARDPSALKYHTIRWQYTRFEGEAEKLAHIRLKLDYGEQVLVLDVAGFDELVTRAEASVERKKARQEKDAEAAKDPAEAKRREREQRKAERLEKKREEAQAAMEAAFLARVQGLQAFSGRDLALLAANDLDAGLDPEAIPNLADVTGIPVATLEAVNQASGELPLEAAVFDVDAVCLLRLLTVLAVQRSPHDFHRHAKQWTGKTVEEWLA